MSDYLVDIIQRGRGPSVSRAVVPMTPSAAIDRAPSVSHADREAPGEIRADPPEVGVAAPAVPPSRTAAIQAIASTQRPQTRVGEVTPAPSAVARTAEAPHSAPAAPAPAPGALVQSPAPTATSAPSTASKVINTPLGAASPSVTPGEAAAPPTGAAPASTAAGSRDASGQADTRPGPALYDPAPATAPPVTSPSSPAPLDPQPAAPGPTDSGAFPVITYPLDEVGDTVSHDVESVEPAGQRGTVHHDADVRIAVRWESLLDETTPPPAPPGPVTAPDEAVPGSTVSQTRVIERPVLGPRTHRAPTQEVGPSPAAGDPPEQPDRAEVDSDAAGREESPSTAAPTHRDVPAMSSGLVEPSPSVEPAAADRAAPGARSAVSARIAGAGPTAMVQDPLPRDPLEITALASDHMRAQIEPSNRSRESLALAEGTAGRQIVAPAARKTGARPEGGITGNSVPPVRVRIGSIELRAVAPPSASAPPPRDPSPLGFEEYAAIRGHAGWGA